MALCPQCALDGISMAHARGPAQFDAESRGLARPGHAWAPGGRGGCRCHCPRFFFGVGDERHIFQLAMELKSQPTPFEAMGIVDDELLFTASQYQRLGACV